MNDTTEVPEDTTADPASVYTEEEIKEKKRRKSNIEIKYLDQAIENEFLTSVIHHPDILSEVAGFDLATSFSTMPKAQAWQHIVNIHKLYGAQLTPDLFDKHVQKHQPGDAGALVMRVYRKVYNAPVPPEAWGKEQVKKVAVEIQYRKMLWEANRAMDEGKLERVPEIIEYCQTITSTASTAGTGFTGKTIDEIEAEIANEPEREHIVDGWLRTGNLSILAGPPKVGKSTLVRHLVAGVIRDEAGEWLGRPIQSTGNVLYCGEEYAPDILDALAVAGWNEDMRARFRLVTNPPKLEGRELVNRLSEAVQANQIKLVVVDTLSTIVDSDIDLNEYSATTGLLDALIEVATLQHCHILLLHHTRKAQGSLIDSILGSRALAGKVDIVMTLVERDDCRLFSLKGRIPSALQVTGQAVTEDGQQGRTPAEQRKQESAEELENFVIDQLQGRREGVTKKPIREAVEAELGGHQVKRLAALFIRLELSNRIRISKEGKQQRIVLL